MRKEDAIGWPPGPFFGLWTLRYLNVLSFIVRQLNGSRSVFMRAYRETLRAGDPLPPVRLKTPEGEAIDLAQFRGKKNLVIGFGAIT